MQIDLNSKNSIQGFIVGALFLGFCWLLVDKFRSYDEQIKDQANNSRTQEQKTNDNKTNSELEPLKTKIELANIMLEVKDELSDMNKKMSDQNFKVREQLATVSTTVKIMSEQNKNLSQEVVRTRESLRTDLTNTNAEVFSIKKEMGLLREESNQLRNRQERITSKLLLLEKMMNKAG